MADLSAPEAVGAAIGALTVTISTILNHVKGKNRTKETNGTLHKHFRELGESIDRRFDTVEKQIRNVEDSVKDVRHFCIGPDGQNGFRGDIKELNNRIDGFEKRERERVDRAVGQMDRRTGS